MAYITATHLLELLPENGPLVVNDPAAVRNAPEKLFVLRFKELMPPTLLTRDRDAIRAFWREHGDIILKPLFGNGGAGVFRLRPGDEIVAIDGRQPRDGRVLEQLGTYDPMMTNKENRVTLYPERIHYWQSVGAQISDKVAILLKKYVAKAAAKPAETAAPAAQ